MTQHDIIILALTIINITLVIGVVLIWASFQRLNSNIAEIYRKVDRLHFNRFQQK